MGTASKSKAVERFAGGQSGLDQVALDAAARAVGDLMLGERGQEARGGPAFFVGLRGDLGPDRLMAGQPQFVEQKFDARGVDGVVALFMPPPPSRDESRFWRRLRPVRRRRRGREFDGDIRNRCAVSARKRSRSEVEVGQAPGVKLGLDRFGEFGLAGAVVRQREQFDHQLAGAADGRRASNASKARS